MRLIGVIAATAAALTASAGLAACAGAARHGGPARPVAAARDVTAAGATTAPPPRAARRAAPRHGRAGQARAPGRADPGTPLPPAARPAATSHPDHVIGHGTPASCTSRAVVRAVAAGGVITFSCGPRPVTITLRATAKIRNTSHRVVLDGGGKVTLSGGGAHRILYLDTCDRRQVWTTSHCQDQRYPQLTVQNITLRSGNSTGDTFDGGGGGAIFDRGGQLKVVNARFAANRCDPTGPDLGGAAIRALDQYRGRPVFVVHSTFTRGVCSNGGALSSIGVSWVVIDCTMVHNLAIGRGANPARPGTPGGGSGAAIYTDGDRYTVHIAGTTIAFNHAREGGGAIFFVSNDRTGTLRIKRSRLHHNPSDGFHTAGFPGIFFLGRGRPVVIDSTIN